MRLTIRLFAVLALLGAIATAAPASADGFRIRITFGSRHGYWTPCRSHLHRAFTPLYASCRECGFLYDPEPYRPRYVVPLPALDYQRDSGAAWRDEFLNSRQRIVQPQAVTVPANVSIPAGQIKEKSSALGQAAFNGEPKHDGLVSLLGETDDPVEQTWLTWATNSRLSEDVLRQKMVDHIRLLSRSNKEAKVQVRAELEAILASTDPDTSAAQPEGASSKVLPQRAKLESPAPIFGQSVKRQEPVVRTSLLYTQLATRLKDGKFFNEEEHQFLIRLLNPINDSWSLERLQKEVKDWLDRLPNDDDGSRIRSIYMKRPA